jgi:effector-binding domain-containing protein
MEPQEGAMTYDVEIRQLDRQPAATIRITTTPKEIGPTLAEVLPEVGRYLQRSGVSASGPPFARYHAYERDRVDMEAGMPVSGPVTGGSRVQPSDLPSGSAATVWHVGPYDKLFRAWAALQAWLKENSWEEAGPGWEMYVTDPGEEPDSSLWKTQVVQPVRRVSQNR